MTTDQILSFLVIAGMMVAFVVERFRYDVTACLALVAAIALGLVPFDKAFSGFSDDIVIIVASALVVSAGVARSGIVDIAIKKFFPELDSFRAQMALLLLVVAILSAFIKNIGALAIMMPAALQFARKSGRSPSRYLMPMAFAALLGGLMTQIGTSPNIVVSRLRQELTGESFTMFDFTPVGLALMVVGVAFLLLFHRLVPERAQANPSMEEALEAKIYASEVQVAAESPAIGQALSDVMKAGDGAVIATAILRGHSRLSPFPDVKLKGGDTLLLEGPPAALDRLVSGSGLDLSVKPIADANDTGTEIATAEVIIARESPLAGLSARELALSNTYGINLLALSRHGQRLRERLGELTLQPGDVAVLQGRRDRLPRFMQDFGLLPLAEREILLGTRRSTVVPVAILAVAMAVTAVGVVPVPVAFFAAALAMVLFRAVPLADLYKSVDGPILVMLAALIPVADTLRTSGASDLIAGLLGTMADGLSPMVALGLILVTAMAVTPFLNNAATVLVVGPIAASFATTLGYRPEAFLMAVAIGAGCDFLTPIGHQCNTLVMGPGGYRFSDYPRLGLPLSFLIVLVSVPLLMLVWPIS